MSCGQTFEKFYLIRSGFSAGGSHARRIFFFTKGI